MLVNGFRSKLCDGEKGGGGNSGLYFRYFDYGLRNESDGNMEHGITQESQRKPKHYI